MRFFKKIILAFIVAAVASGCAKKDKRQQIRVGRNARGPSEITDRGATDQNGQPIRYSPSSGTSWGEMTGSPENAFQDAIYYLVSASIDPKELGTVSGRSGQSTGVRFWGYVETEASFTTGPSNQRIRRDVSEIRISIWDSFVGKTDASGNLIPEYPIHIRGSADGYVEGTRAVITFSDSYGSIKLEGTIGKDNFQGVVKFDNARYWDGATPGAEGTIGNFSVPTCGFFKCN